MEGWLLLAVGFAAGTFFNRRDLPIAAIALGGVLLFAGHQLGVFTA
ncbi:MAG: hypothetical protein MUE83_00900 [Tabrizicola sp.]|jgi:hypothetical protein|nr:hypothetical protein [Tabrizicola sp.]